MLVALTVAGSDSSGGAGIEADIKALASIGVHAAVALTAVTAQNTQRVASIYPLPPEQVVSQIDAVLEDAHVSAAKTGMLFSGPIAAAVAKRLEGENIPLVVDPVLVAGVGDPLGREDLIDALRDRVVPRATILTPNVPEAEALVGREVRTEADVRRACLELGDMGAEAVLLKGGHLPVDEACATCTDTMYFAGKFLQLEVPRVEVRGHGGGCILSSYLAAHLARGLGVWEAALAAKSSLDQAVRSNYPVGKGVPVVDPLGGMLRDAQRYQVSDRLRRAARSYLETVPAEWVPSGGVRMRFALPGATGPREVASLDDGAGASRARGTGFDTSPRDAVPVLEVMRFDEGIRSVLDLPGTKEHWEALRRSGLSIGTADVVAKSRGKVARSERSMEDAIRELGFVPDALCVKGSSGTPVIYLLAQGPEELLEKFRRVL